MTKKSESMIKDLMLYKYKPIETQKVLLFSQPPLFQPNKPNKIQSYHSYHQTSQKRLFPP